MTFWALLTLVLLLSALVAYLGDRVAKWAGKRHYRLFGLRPRQTATLVAILTGVGIALFSYLGFLLVFREARETILEAQAIREERDRLKEEREVLLKAREAMEAEAARALSELNALRAERKELAEALREAEALKERLQGEVLSLESRVRALQGEKARLEAERLRLSRLLAEKEEALAGQSKVLTERGRALEALEARLQGLERAALQAEADKKRLEGERRRLEAELLLLQRRLEEARGERQALQDEAQAMRLRLLQAQKELAQAEARLRALLQQAQVLEGERGQLSERLLRLSQGLYLGEVRLGAEEGRAALERVADRRAILQGFRGAELLAGEVRGPGLAVLEGAGYRDGTLLVRFRFYPEKKAFSSGEVLASATFRLATPARNQEFLERLGEEVQRRLLEVGFPPEYAAFPSPEELARGLSLLQGRRGVVRVGVVAAKDLWTTQRPLLAFQLLGGPPGPEVPVPTQKVP